MKLLIVIVSYRVTELTIDCLRSLAPRIHLVPGARVAVCENGTGPEHVERLRAEIERNGWGSWVELTAIEPNRGFTGGNNVVLRAALAGDDPPEYALLLNADTVVRDGALERLVEFMDANPDVGIAGSRLVWPDGTAQASPFRFIGIGTEFQRALRLGLFSRVFRRPICVTPHPDRACRVDWVAGASMIIRRAVLEQVGLLDEGLYTYFDDIDLCLRAKRAGWETWFVPESRVTHLEGQTTGIADRVIKRRPDYWFQARRRYYLKNFGPLYALAVDLAFLGGFVPWRVRRWVQRKPDTDPPHMLEDFLRNSVFRQGFAVREVENPALADAAQEQGAARRAAG